MNWQIGRLILVVLLGIAVGAGAMWGFQLTRDGRVQVIEGWTTNVNEEGTAIGVESEPEGPAKTYVISGAFWREEGGSWHTSGETCLEPLTSDQHVRIGVVRARPRLEAPGREVVVWLECLD